MRLCIGDNFLHQQIRHSLPPQGGIDKGARDFDNRSRPRGKKNFRKQAAILSGCKIPMIFILNIWSHVYHLIKRRRAPQKVGGPAAKTIAAEQANPT